MAKKKKGHKKKQLQVATDIAVATASGVLSGLIVEVILHLIHH